MKLYVHIGTHKTGTSEIQSLLKNSSGLIRKNKRLIYIKTNEIFVAISKQKLSSDELSQKLRSHISKFISEFIKLEECEDIVVLSYENFSGIALDGYKNSDAISEILFNAANFFDAESSVIVYLRRQDHFLESLYAQYIKQGKSWGFNEFLSMFDSSSFNWEVLVSNYSKWFGINNIKIGLYEKSRLIGGDLIKDFSSKIGYELEQLDFIGKNNGYSREALEVARICNDTFEPNDKKKLRALLQATNYKNPFETYSLFDSIDERYEFLVKYENSNVKIGMLLDNPLAFQVEGNVLDSSFDGLQQNDIIRVVMRALIECQRKKK